MSKQAIIVVDLQNEYLPSGKLPLSGIEAATAHAARVIAAARARQALIIHIRHEIPDPAAPIFATGSAGVEIIADVAPLESEAVVVKQHPNSFRDTGLQSLLNEHGILSVVIVGAMSHMCIEATARAGADLGYQVTVQHDAAATRDLDFGDVSVPAQQVHAASMAALAFSYAQVISVEAWLADLEG
ncbi:cysteine hydrolase family protein [Sphingobium sp. WCS2017Hpa-17]|uniref:cysteine hydrolase family protein n=1 Tax=Sphingobium sp. WCS2017Hpa-17 TaxID=3073638 RepID=UPI00288A40B7|nr:cysteine hydrolase family protein [Sphingobium sp. WCS2017Hpa-17]